MIVSHHHAVQLKIAPVFLVLLLLTLLSIQAEETDLPEQNALLSTLQTAAGKKWIVEKVPQGYLLTYASPVTFYRAFSESSKSSLNRCLSDGRKEPLQLKIIFGTATNPGQILHSQTDIESDLEVPSDVTSHDKLTPAHYFITNPPVWAIGHHYSVYFVVNEAPKESTSPKQADDDCYQVLETVGEVFGCHPLMVIEN